MSKLKSSNGAKASSAEPPTALVPTPDQVAAYAAGDAVTREALITEVAWAIHGARLTRYREACAAHRAALSAKKPSEAPPAPGWDASREAATKVLDAAAPAAAPAPAEPSPAPAQ